MTKLKISICTVSMNRIHHIKKTLPRNISDNLKYPNIEFILLDYNSNDGLFEWVNLELKEHIDSGVLKIYKTEEPLFFDRSHSRNVVFKLATGDVICNVDADNYIGNGFASFVNNEFSTKKDIYLVADTKKRLYFLRNAFGRFCVRKEDLMKIGGLDEEMKSYGSETVDFYERIELSGKKEIIIKNTNFLKAISHGDEERISNEFFLKSLHNMYIRFINHESSEFIILYKDHKYETGFIEPELVETHLPAALKEGTLKKGEWKENNSTLYLSLYQDFIIIENKILSHSGKLFYKMDNKEFLLNVAKNYSFISNVNRMNSNSENNISVVNNSLFGIGEVYNSKGEIIILD